MALTKTTVAVIAAGCLALGAGASWLLTQPSGEPSPTAIETPAKAQPEARSVALTPPVATTVPTTAPPGESETPGPARPMATESRRTEPRRPGVQVARQLDTKTPPRALETNAAPAPPATTGAAPVPPSAEEPPSSDRLFEELVVSTNTVLGLRIDTAVSSEDARVEDRVTATVTRDIRVGDHVAIPTGATAHGEVTLVERGGRVKERARLGVRFTSIALGNGTRVPVDTDVILREGDSAAKESTAKIGGGAVGGAIIGAIIGGRKGAAIGSTVGAGAGTAAVMAGGRNAARLEAGEAVSVHLTKPTAVTVGR